MQNILLNAKGPDQTTEAYTDLGLHCSCMPTKLIFFLPDNFFFYFSIKKNYCIQPNYCTTCLAFAKLLGKLAVKYVSTYTKGTLIQRSADDLSNYAYVMFLCFLFLIFFIKAYVVGKHLNCINKSMHFKWVPTTYAFIRRNHKKYTGCNLKTTESLDCALIGLYAVIR